MPSLGAVVEGLPSGQIRFLTPHIGQSALLTPQLSKEVTGLSGFFVEDFFDRGQPSGLATGFGQQANAFFLAFDILHGPIVA